MEENKYGVIKETEIILIQFLIDQRVDVSLEEPTQDTSISEVNIAIPSKKKDQSHKKVTPKG